MENILIAGVHGTTGQKIIKLLKMSEDFEPIAMVRVKDQVNFFKSLRVKTVLANLEDDVSQAVQNIDKVIFAAGSGG